MHCLDYFIVKCTTDFIIFVHNKHSHGDRCIRHIIVYNVLKS